MHDTVNTGVDCKCNINLGLENKLTLMRCKLVN